MDIHAQINIPEYVYNFYRDAARSIAGKTTEQIIADALTAYAAMLSKDVMTIRNHSVNNERDRIIETG